MKHMETPEIINIETVPPGYMYKIIEVTGRTYVYARLESGNWYEGFLDKNGSINYESEFSFSGIPTIFKGKGLKDFRTDIYVTSNLDAANTTLKSASNYVKRFESNFHNEGMGLYFYSESTGCGKSLIASIIGNELISRGINVKFVKSINFYEELKAEINNNVDCYLSRNTMNDMQKADVLIFDDLGAENAKDYEKKKFYQLIDGRFNAKRATIFTSKKSFSRLTYDESILELIKQRTIPVTLPKESVCDKLITQQNKAYQDLLNE